MPAAPWLFITVSDESAASRLHLGALLASLERQGVAGDLVLVMRGCDAPAAVGDRGLVRVHPVASPLQIGLSRARNLGLAHARALGLLHACGQVAFPDDDARYPAGLLEHVGAVLRRGATIVCGPYAPDRASLDRRRFPWSGALLTPNLVMRVASSNNLFFRAAVVHAVGGFDERLGLGARYGASEDSDYVLRALARGFVGVYDSEALVEHPYKPGRVDEYYRGNVAVLAKHARAGGTALLLVRRLATGVLLTARRRLAPMAYLRMVGDAIALGAGRAR
jgi:GT2 family glycosyltransferase